MGSGMAGLLEPLLPFTGYLALFLRVVVGASLMMHGYPKTKGIRGTTNFVQTMGIPSGAAYAVAALVTALEFIGGLFLIVGLIVPVVGFFFAIQFVAITIAKKFKLKGTYVSGQGPVKYEIDVLYLLLAIVLMVLGAGAFSIDGALGL
jgi:putative oxidoreductase